MHVNNNKYFWSLFHWISLTLNDKTNEIIYQYNKSVTVNDICKSCAVPLVWLESGRHILMKLIEDDLVFSANNAETLSLREITSPK